MERWLTILGSLVLALGGSAGMAQLFQVRSTKRNLLAGTEKIKAEAADILSDSAVALLAPLRDELVRTTQKADELARRVAELEVTLTRERVTSDTRIRQLEADIAARDREILSLRGGT